MVVNNTVKHEGCARDTIRVCSVQSFVKKEKGELNSAKYNAVMVEHANNDIVIKAQTHDIIKDNAGKIIERRNARTRADELTH